MGFTLYESLSVGTQRSVGCLYELVSVLSGLILEKIYELFVGTNETFRNIRVSVFSLSTDVLFCQKIVEHANENTRGGGGGEVFNKVLYGEAPPRGSNPYTFIYHF